MAEGAEFVLEQNHEEAPAAVAVSGLAQEPPLTAAFQLGWRVAELYALVNDPGEPSDDTLLPGHESLEPGDQLQLQLRAAAGDARRAGIAAKADELEALLPDAGGAPGSAEAAERFRAKIRSFHIEISKELWAGDEAAGKAYELGNGMSDTYSLVRIAYRTRSEDLTAAWERVFRKRRIERLEKLLDDLQSRLNPGGVAVVRHHLDLWRKAVPARIVEPDRPPKEQQVKCGLRRQTVIWRQLLAGDKEPVAYLNGAARAELHGAVRGLAWRGVRPWLIPAALGLFAFIFFLPEIVGLYQDGIVGTGVASAFLAAAGALGVTKASMAATARSRLRRWSELLWDRAVAEKVSEKTLVLEEVIAEAVPDRGRIASASRAVKGKIASGSSSIAPRPSRPASF
jgi:hypothetical protein